MASLNDITGISIKGGCYTHDDKPTILDGILKEPINILFGRNGSGKSTLARALNEYAHPDPTKPDEYEVNFIGGELSADQRERIFVFNESFVRENVATREDGLGTIIIIGKKDLEIQNKIEQLEEKISDAEIERKRIEAICKMHEDKKAHGSKAHAWELLWNAMQADNKYAARERDIKGNIKKGSVTEDTVRKIADKCRGKAIDPNLKHIFDSKFSQLKTLKAGGELFWAKPTIELPFDIDAIATLLAKKVENPELNEREKYLLEISQQSKYNFVGMMEDDILKNRRNVCPICLQSIDENQRKTMVEAVTHILNKEVGGHKHELRAALATITNSDYSLPSLPSEIYDDDLGDAQACLDELNRLTEALQDQVDKKIKSPITPITGTTLINNLMNAIEELRKAFDKLGNDVAEYNNNIKDRKKMEQELLDMNDQLAWMEHNLQIEGYLAKANDYRNATENSRQLSQEIIKLNDELKEQQSSKSDFSEAAKVINQSLRDIFADSTRMSIKYDSRMECYKLKSRGKDVQPDRISEGERNIIGLAYFFASINAHHEVNEIYKDPVLLMIDDPISSYDYNNKIGVITFISSQIETMKEKNEGSKVILMSHDMQTIQRFVQVYHNIYNLSKKQLVPVYRLENGKATKTTEMERSDTYKRLLHQIYDFAISTDPKEVEDLTIGNEIRRVLESYCTFNYQRGIGYMRTLAQNAIGLKGEEKKEKREKYMTFIRNSFFHTDSHSQADMEESQYDFETSYEEKRNTAQHVLMLLFYINKYHLQGYFDDNEMSVIENWCNNDTKYWE